ncbi:hypothetical protein [Nonomuraea rhodomycinica]|uniref:Uncharacterized protein n=1 Tax=Nonomuraea rhodomycinica TaxID=1712872 RepID=A0A7Y6IS18_9ACTN|nr:hypothetical protein [Nonomuraea rhodomycinica]NUW43140.1 hypothetical protein [Nonomuraea rhodomycinica]
MTADRPLPNDPDARKTVHIPVPAQSPPSDAGVREARPGPSDEDAPAEPPPPAPHPSLTEDTGTRRLPYTPDMLPDVPVYEAEPARSPGVRWVLVAGGALLVLAAVALLVILWAGSQQ